MPKPLNILVLMGDHHRHDAMGWRGNPLARTPNLDALAARSRRFLNCFTQSPVCSPARHSLATSQYTRTHGVSNNGDAPHAGMTTIAHALGAAGYRRINIGHMHWHKPTPDTGYEPLQMNADWEERIPPRARQIHEWESQSLTRRRTGGPSPRTREEYSGFWRARRAIEEMESAAAENKPFLCWLALSEPHPPFYPPREYYARTDQSRLTLPAPPPPGAPAPHPSILRKREEWAHLTDVEIRQVMAGYYGLVELMDEYVGEALAALDRLGLRDNTVVVWTSDHGEQLWEHQLFTKFVMRESSVHVPLMIAGPGLAPGDCEALVEHVDLAPTLCDLAGATIPASFQGRSLRPWLEGGAPAQWRDTVFSQIGQHEMVRTDEWKLNVYDGEPGELYHLASDPGEHVNRIADSACATVADGMMERLLQWRARHPPLAGR